MSFNKKIFNLIILLGMQAVFKSIKWTLNLFEFISLTPAVLSYPGCNQSLITNALKHLIDQVEERILLIEQSKNTSKHCNINFQLLSNSQILNFIV